MTTRDIDNQPMALSLLANREVSTSSEEWRHECEVGYLLDMPIAARNLLRDGVTGGTHDERGIKGARGEAAVAQLRLEIVRLGVSDVMASAARSISLILPNYPPAPSRRHGLGRQHVCRAAANQGQARHRRRVIGWRRASDIRQIAAAMMAAGSRSARPAQPKLTLAERTCSSAARYPTAAAVTGELGSLPIN